MKVLLSAFSCHPGRGSEPGIGWGVSQTVAKEHEVWVLTDAANRDGIEKAMKGLSNPRLRFVYIGHSFLRSVVQKANTLGIPLGSYLYYLLWQYAAFQAARRLHQSIRFDLVHHVTFGNSWMLTFMGYLGVPFIWSAGLREQTPWQFMRVMSWRGTANEAVRNLIIASLGRITLQFVGRRAALIISASAPEYWPNDLPVVRLPLGGLETEEIKSLVAVPLRSNARPFRVASIGRLLGWKGFGLGLQAFARLREEIPDAEYWIIGDGPERNYLERLASQLGCRDAVRFIGWVPRKELPQYLSEIDVMLHPSLYEQFGYAVLEAMVAGRPVVCLDVGGPALLVRDGCGMRIPMQNPEQVVTDLYEALLHYALEPSARFTAGMNARVCAQCEWSWDAVGARLLCLYNQVVG